MHDHSTACHFRRYVMLACVAVIVSSCSLPLSISPYADKYAALYHELTQACTETLSNEETTQYVEHGWFSNENAPTLQAVNKAIREFDTACAALDEGLPLWAGQDDYDDLEKLSKKITKAVDNAKSLEENAQIYLEYSLTLLQASFTNGVYWQTQRGMVTPSDSLYEAAAALSTLRKSLQESTEEPDVSAEDLSEFTEQLQTATANLREELEATALLRPEYLEAIAELPSIDSEAATGKIAVFNEDFLPVVTKSIEEIAANPPQLAPGTAVLNATADGDTATVMYSVENGQSTAIIETVDAPDPEVFVEGQSIGFTGARNEICTKMQVCWAQTSDGQWWKSTIDGFVSNATSRGFILSFLDKIG